MMERNFDMSDFEQSLKDHADQFVMVPSKRVWNGIYNHLHPGSKWPSITVALVLLITLIAIGNLNNSPEKTQKNLDETSTSTILSKGPTSKATNNKDSYSENTTNSKKNESLANALNGIVSNNGGVIDGRDQENGIGKKNITSDNLANTKSENDTRLNETNIENTSKQSIAPASKNISSITKISSSQNPNDNNLTQNHFSIISIASNDQDLQQYINPVDAGHVDDFNSFLFAQRVNTNATNEFENFQNNVFILKENFQSIKNDLVIPAFNLEKNTNSPQPNAGSVNSKAVPHADKAASPTHKKKNNKIEWTYYVTPVISNAIFRGKGIEPPANNYSPIVIYQTPSNNGMIYHAKLGFETGAEMTYSLSKKLKFVTGFNISYSDYHIISNLLHPTFATLMFQDKSSGSVYSKNYITFYGNGQSLNQIALTNYNLQVSIPAGLQYQIWGNKKTQINLVSTIEPSLSLKSDSYIISADKRYYVNDPSLMRKVNLGGSFGTFVTFSGKKVKWHVGPDIHYQLLSTYKNYYPIKEHLINYGIRIGISK